MLPLFIQKKLNRLRRSLWAAPMSIVPAPFRGKAKGDATIAGEIADHEKQAGYAHCAGSLPLRTLLRIEGLLPGAPINSAETGCGKSTIFLSRVAQKHRVFCLDDRESGRIPAFPISWIARRRGWIGSRPYSADTGDAAAL